MRDGDFARIADRITAREQRNWNQLNGRLGQIRGRLSGILTSQVLAVVQIALVLPAAVAYCTSGDERVRERHYQAWQVIAAWHGKTGDGGRIDALEDLNRDGVSLRGVEISSAYLDSVRLTDGDMKDARLSRASMRGANLAGAFAARSRMMKTNLYAARAHDADFVFAAADSALFSGATLCRSLFLGASLRNATFENAILDSADFRGADLREARFSTDSLPAGSRFAFANVAGVTPAAFRRAALARGAVAILDDSLWSTRAKLLEGHLKRLWFNTDTARRARMRSISPERRACGQPSASDPA